MFVLRSSVDKAEMSDLEIIGRASSLFDEDIAIHRDEIENAVRGSRVLVYGGAGSIGKEVIKQFFALQPSALHVLDISENNLTELVRDLRSSQGYIEGDAQFLPIDMMEVEAQAFLAQEPAYDYVLNLAAMKHVRSEKDAFSLMRMIKVNVLGTHVTLERAKSSGSRRYFAVSTDKAKNPANLMGATKRVSEDVLFKEGQILVTTARFANVAFSDGSLLHGFRQRLALRQPISAPKDIRRYFVTGSEAGKLCLAASVLGFERNIFFPKLDPNEHLLTFSEIASRFLIGQGFEPVVMSSEEEARSRVSELVPKMKWPVFYFESDTSGEKPFEEFYSEDDDVDWARFKDIGVIKTPSLPRPECERLKNFLDRVCELRAEGHWSKEELTALLRQACPTLEHVDTGKSLDSKM